MEKRRGLPEDVSRVPLNSIDVEIITITHVRIVI